MPKPDRVDRLERRQKRREVASAVRSGLSIAEACKKFDVAPSYVYNSLAEFFGGSKNINRPTKVYEIIAALHNTSDTSAAIAERLRISPQRVSEVLRDCIKYGVFASRKKRKT